MMGKIENRMFVLPFTSFCGFSFKANNMHFFVTGTQRFYRRKKTRIFFLFINGTKIFSFLKLKTLQIHTPLQKTRII